MVYKNFILRTVFSFLFLLIYLLISFINFNYVYYLILLIYIIIIFEINSNFIKYKSIPIIYVLISFIFFSMINFENDSFILFNLFVFCVIIFDIFSYLIGKFLGKNKLLKISPNKTVEGFLGGFITSLILSISLVYYFEINNDFNTILFLILIILSAFAGDIIESFYKRKNNLKNSSELIPGHGGVFDRFDSFLFSIIFYSISINLLI